jgi:predicted membrane-bound mannosyltransferase
VVDGGVTQVDLDGGVIAASVMTQTAAAFAANDFAIVHAGGVSVTDASGTMPTPDRILIGADQAGNYQNGIIKRLIYWPVRLSDAILREVTR